MVSTAPLLAEIKLHGVGLAAQRLGMCRRHPKSPSQKSLLLTFSLAIGSKRATPHSVVYYVICHAS